MVFQKINLAPTKEMDSLQKRLFDTLTMRIK